MRGPKKEVQASNCERETKLTSICMSWGRVSEGRGLNEGEGWKGEDSFGEDNGREGWENKLELGVSLGQAGILVI